VSAINTLALEDWTESTTTATLTEADWHNGILQSATGRVIFPAPSSLEDGWHVTVFNAATGIIQLQATATGFFHTFDGTLASETELLPGAGARVYNTATAFLPVGLLGGATDIQTRIGLVPGVDIHAFDSDLDDLAGLTATRGAVILGTAGTATDWGTFASASDNDMLVADAAENTGWKVVQQDQISGVNVLGKLTATSESTKTFTSELDNTKYSSYYVVLESILPSTDAAELQVRMDVGGGIITTAYLWSYDGRDGGGSTISNQSTSAVGMEIGLDVGSAANEGLSGKVEFPVGGVSNRQIMNFNVGWMDNDGTSRLNHLTGAGSHATTGALTSIQFRFSAGNIASGSFTLYGQRIGT
jgi:hypothetical protein